MVLVTGAAGKTGRAVIRALTARGVRVRALVRGDAQIPVVRSEGAVEVVAGDLRNDDAVARAVGGVVGVYHICPNVHPDELAIGQRVLAACRGARVDRLVYHSVMHPQTQAMPHHWQKLLVEERILESGLAYTILQPASYMQNVFGDLGRIVREGCYSVPYAPETRLGMVDLDDVAAAAAIVLADAAHVGATYELAGGEVLTPGDVAVILTRVLGRPVRVEHVAVEAWAARARASGMSDYHVATLTAMFRYYERYGFWGNATILTSLLGRAPATFEPAARRIFEHATA